MLFPFLLKMSHVFSIIGDSNIKRNMTRLNRRTSPLMNEAQVLLCSSMSTLNDTVTSVRDSSNVLVFSCISNFITDVDSSGSSSVSVRIEPILEEFKAVVDQVRKLGTILIKTDFIHVVSLAIFVP